LGSKKTNGIVKIKILTADQMAYLMPIANPAIPDEFPTELKKIVPRIAIPIPLQ
jgi:hypothetical protein